MLPFLLDALSAIGEAEAMIFFGKAFLFVVVPLGLLLIYGYYRIGKQFDREPKPLRVRPLPSDDAGSGRYLLLILVSAMCFAVIVLVWGLR